MYQIFESINDNNEIYDYYCTRDNYERIFLSNKTKRVIIFFTGHGLFFPTTIEEFRKEVIQNNKFEWKSLGCNCRIMDTASEYVFVRDIYKNWCLQGINEKINTQEKIVTLLREIVNGREVITVGSSAGGYMAILFGILLGASTIYAFSPQISLKEYHKVHPIKNYDEYVQNPQISKYMDLVPLMKEFQGNIFYWFPYYCDEDLRQYNIARQCNNVCFFSMNQEKHGATLWGESIIQTLTMCPEKSRHLSVKYESKVIDPYIYCKDTSGILKAQSIRLIKQVKKYLIK